MTDDCGSYELVDHTADIGIVLRSVRTTVVIVARCYDDFKYLSGLTLKSRSA